MCELFKKHKKTVIVSFTIVVLAPIAINLIAVLPSFCPNWVAGSQQGVWVNFFAVYSSSLIGAFVSFYILYNTIEANKKESKQNRKDNHAENEANRTQLKTVFKYQVDREILNTTKSYLANYVQSLNILELGYITIYPKERVKESLLELKKISSNAIQFYELLELALVEYNDEKAKAFKDFLIRFHNEYMGLIKDFGWILDFYLFNKIEVDSKMEALKYKEREHGFGDYYNEDKRIWKIIENGDYNIYKDATLLMNELLDRFEYFSIIKEIKLFIKYEQTKIEETMLKANS